VLVNTLKLAFYVSSLYSLLDSVCVCISIAKTSIWRVLYLPGYYVCAFYPVHHLCSDWQ